MYVLSNVKIIIPMRLKWQARSDKMYTNKKVGNQKIIHALLLFAKYTPQQHAS